jgi:hypothetical protein
MTASAEQCVLGTTGSVNNLCTVAYISAGIGAGLALVMLLVAVSVVGARLSCRRLPPAPAAGTADRPPVWRCLCERVGGGVGLLACKLRPC